MFLFITIFDFLVNSRLVQKARLLKGRSAKKAFLVLSPSESKKRLNTVADLVGKLGNFFNNQKNFVLHCVLFLFFIGIPKSSKSKKKE